MRLNLRSEKQRYIVVGISIYLLEVVIIAVAQTLGANLIAAVGLSFWTGLLVSFWLQKWVTFEDKRMQRKVVAGQLAATVLLVFFNFGFTILTAKLLQNILPAVLIRTLALACCTIWNFYLYKTRIFKNTGEPVIY